MKVSAKSMLRVTPPEQTVRTNWSGRFRPKLMSKLRLKKRCDGNSTLNSSTKNSRVEVPAGNGDFKLVGLSTARGRSSLHKLLFGDEALTFSPLPPSQLEKFEVDEKKIKCSSIEIGSDSDEETKWTPLPRPNTEALIHQLPHSPLLTTEELLAPSSDEEEGDGVEVKRKRESGPMDALQKEMTLKRERESIASGIVSDPCSLRDRSTPAATSSVGQVSLTAEIKDRQTKSACSVSEFIKGLKTTPQASTDSREIPTNDAEGMHIRDVIDLTDTSPKKQANPCSSSHQSAPNNHTSSASASLSPSLPAHPTSSSADQYQLQDEEEDDFDVLCLSVDWSTIDDFSDPEPPAASEPSNTATVASHSTSISNTTAAIHSSYTSSKGKYRAGYSEMPVKNHVSGAKRPSNIDNSLRSKRARFEDSEKELCPFSSHGSTDAGPSCAQQQRSSLSVPQRVPHGTSESLSSSVHPTTAVTEGRQWRTPNSGPTPAPRGTSGAGVVEPQAGPAGGGGRGRVTPLGSQLTTENCPMCNTRFPSWYEQVDADRHIAECLQAIMDLETENDLVLL